MNGRAVDSCNVAQPHYGMADSILYGMTDSCSAVLYRMADSHSTHGMIPILYGMADSHSIWNN